MKVRPPLPTVGWRECVSLPELGIADVVAKVDTGARTSALHAFHQETFRRKGARYVRFDVHPVQRRRNPSVRCEARIADERTVISSNGERELRYVVETRLRIGDHDWLIELTLTNRDQMGFRMLLGREALRRRLIVDPAKSFCLGKKPAERRTGSVR